MRATHRHSILATMAKGLTYPPDKIIRLAIVKIFSAFGGELRFRRLFGAVNIVLFHLGHAPIDEGALSWRCDKLARMGALLRVDDRTRNLNTVLGSGLRPGTLTAIYGRPCIVTDRYYSGPYDPWMHISYRMDPLHRLAAAL